MLRPSARLPLCRARLLCGPGFGAAYLLWGDGIRRLPNGNYLVAAGIRAPPVESRVFEVAKTDKKVVWEFRFPTDYGVYRARRITPPLIRAITP
jgi:hypothetical protein